MVPPARTEVHIDDANLTSTDPVARGVLSDCVLFGGRAACGCGRVGNSRAGIQYARSPVYIPPRVPAVQMIDSESPTRLSSRVVRSEVRVLARGERQRHRLSIPH